MQRLLLWTGVDAWRTEVANVDLRPDGVLAWGTQVGVDPLPYRLDYTLDATDNFATRSLVVEVTGEGWSRRVALARDGTGVWRCEAAEVGRADLPSPGGDTRGLLGASDCDLGLSPMTNLMPIRRSGLHQHTGTVELTAAWVSVPDLVVHASRQRYEHVRIEEENAVVRYTDLGVHSGFVADILVDSDGLVLKYSDLARRVEGGA